MSDYLPWDMIVEILSRLPVKSLMRFKCVSKSLYYLISQNDDFKKKHLHQSNFERAIVCYKWEGSSVILCHPSSLALSNGPVNEDVIRIDVPGFIGGFVYWERTISNSCDGLFCVRDNLKGLLIWNPHTREFKKIPDCTIDYTGELFSTVSYGLVYDSVSDDYKVIGVVAVHGDPDFRQFNIYPLKTCSPWRNIKDDFPCKYFTWKDNNTVVNGAFHWIAYDDRYSPSVLISLDVANEKFNKYALPSPLACLDGKLFDQRPILCVKLCMFEWSYYGFNLWMMEEYGVVQSLRKILTVTIAITGDTIGLFALCRPMYMYNPNV